jgi:cytochrome c oxidase accessory protein FixG
MENTEGGKPSFRDRLYTIDESGKRLWVFAKKPKGKLTTARNITGIFLMLFFFTAPFIRIHEQPLLLLDFYHRTFVFFGVQFWPQDFHLFFIAMIALIVFIILFTAVYGRLFCGWACPQTVFMEVLFRRIEYWIEGDFQKQKQLDKMPWNGEKILKRVLKHGIFYILAFIIGNYFLMYLMGTGPWKKLVTDDPRNHIAGLAGMVVFSFVFYFIFSWFREQVCTIVCPYGRLQGVLLDRQTIVISYDYKRGEERGVFRKEEDRAAAKKGDCIDCKLCVMVCPTGIDIRNGTQLECINCACCIDACNETMRRTGFKPGLIRYASEKTIADGTTWKPTFRTLGYTAVLVVLLGVLTYFLSTRNPVEATVLRAPGMLFQDQGNGLFSNLYDVKVVNKTAKDLPLEFRLLSRKGAITIVGGSMTVKKQTVGEGVFFVMLEKSQISGEKTELTIGVFSGEKKLDETKVTFVGPK